MALQDTICPICRGDGEEAHGIPCDTCKGTGLSAKVNIALTNGVYDAQDKVRLEGLLALAVKGIVKAREMVRNVDYEVDADVGTEEALGAIDGHLTALLEALDPDAPERD